MKRSGLIIVSALALFGSPLLAEPATQPEPTAPVAHEQAPTSAIQKLIHELGDADPSTRDAASRRLKEIGQPALEALKQAAESDQPEVRARAQVLVRRIERRPIPGGPIAADGRQVARNVRIRIVDGAKQIDVTEDGRTFKIVQGPNGIQVTISAVENGKLETEVYEAATPEELREEHPEVFAVFRQWGGGAGPAWVLGRGIGLHGEILVGNAEIIDELDGLTQRLVREMIQARLPADQRREVLDLLTTMRALRGIQLGMGAEEHERRIKQFLAQSDRLREKLEELKLPDPGEALPPPNRARLGIQLRAAPIVIPGGGVLVESVMSESRAEKLGMKPGDVLRKINAKEVATVAEVRKAVSESKPPLVVEVERGGKLITLEEQPEAAQKKGGE